MIVYTLYEGKRNLLRRSKMYEVTAVFDGVEYTFDKEDIIKFVITSNPKELLLDRELHDRINNRIGNIIKPSELFTRNIVFSMFAIKKYNADMDEIIEKILFNKTVEYVYNIIEASGDVKNFIESAFEAGAVTKH